MRCIRNRVYCIVGAVLAIGVLSCTALLSAEPHAEEPRATSSHVDGSTLDRGRYLLRIAGCNDCHTPGYQQSAGAVDESQWLTGDAIGWQGPWGVTYPPNLRLFVQNRLSASLVILLLVGAVGFLSSLWVGTIPAGTWTSLTTWRSAWRTRGSSSATVTSWS